ncbi:hypothetical protein [Deinococcus sonorensis]|uniref:Transposase n=2 Tax=Deinococcus sonorensis TaxID=309891 RepID=A0AAU7UBT1_9DEIO
MKSRATSSRKALQATDVSKPAALKPLDTATPLPVAASAPSVVPDGAAKKSRKITLKALLRLLELVLEIATGLCVAMNWEHALRIVAALTVPLKVYRALLNQQA